jgi:DNA-binding protein YbaB
MNLDMIKQARELQSKLAHAQKEQLEIFLLRALNDAQEKVQKVAAQSLKEATGGMKIPGLF